MPSALAKWCMARVSCVLRDLKEAMGAQLQQCRNLTPDAIAKGRAASVKARGLAAKEAYADLMPVLAEMRAKGMALQAIAGELNAQGHTTRRGRPWNPVQSCGSWVVRHG